MPRTRIVEPPASEPQWRQTSRPRRWAVPERADVMRVRRRPACSHSSREASEAAPVAPWPVRGARQGPCRNRARTSVRSSSRSVDQHDPELRRQCALEVSLRTRRAQGDHVVRGDRRDGVRSFHIANWRRRDGMMTCRRALKDISAIAASHRARASSPPRARLSLPSSPCCSDSTRRALRRSRKTTRKTTPA